MNKNMYKVVEEVDTELSKLVLLSKLAERLAFVNSEKVGNECANREILKEEALELWSLIDQIKNQIIEISDQIQNVME